MNTLNSKDKQRCLINDLSSLSPDVIPALVKYHSNEIKKREISRETVCCYHHEFKKERMQVEHMIC